MSEAQWFPTLHVTASATLMPMVLRRDDTTGAEIIKAVADEFGLSVSDVKSQRRQPNLVKARQMFMLLARQFAKHLSYPQIGEIVRRDHTTVMYGANKAADRLERDEWYAAKRRRILARLAYEQ